MPCFWIMLASEPRATHRNHTDYWLCIYGGGDDVGMANEKKFFKSMRWPVFFSFYFADLQLIKTESSTKYRNKNDSARKKRSKILKQVEKVVVSIPFDSIWIWISTAAATYTRTHTLIIKTWPQPNSINWVSATIASAATATPSSHDWLHMPQEREVIFDRMMWYFHLNDLYIK